MFPLVVSYYTRQTGYQLEAEHLRQSCERFGIDHVIEGIDSQGSWELNCAYKPFFMLEMLKRYQRSLLWVDADAVFVKKPRLLAAFKSDFAIYRQPGLKEAHPSKVRSGTVFAAPTDVGMSIVREWIGECHRQLTDPTRTEVFWDQIALRNVALKNSAVASLPLSYIKIFNHPIDEKKCLSPTIVHLQASSRLI